jgi:hypothetical protein
MLIAAVWLPITNSNAPHLPRYLHNQLQLCDLIFNPQLVAEHGAGKSALRADTELNQLPPSKLLGMNP